jgi:hypothetical protein
MTIARGWYHTATLLRDGKVLIAGGHNASDTTCQCYFLASAELYDPSTGSFAATGDMAPTPASHTATALSDGRILIAGGSAQLYDPDTGRFSITGEGSTPLGDFGPIAGTATLLTSGKVLITLEFAEDYSNGASIYDPLTGTFTAAANMTGYRGDRTATLLSDGTVLITGVAYGASWGGPESSNAEFYDATAGAFSLAGPMTAQRQNHTATLLPDDTVLLAGGRDPRGIVESAETYIPTVLKPSP